MNIYYKFALLLILPFLSFACEKEEIEEKSIYGKGVLTIIYSNVNSNKSSSDIAHFAENGTVTYDLFRKANNDSIAGRIQSIEEGEDVIYVVCMFEIKVLDKLTLVQKKSIPIAGGYITNFLYMREHQTAIITTSGEQFLMKLPEGQILKNITDKNYFETKYNSDNDEVLGLINDRGGDSYRIEHLDASTLNKMSEVGSFKNTSSIRKNDLKSDDSHYKFDGNYNLWKQTGYRYDFTFRLYRYYFEVMVRNNNSAENLGNYLPNRKIYQLKKDNDRDLYIHTIGRKNNTFYYGSSWREVSKINISEIDDTVYEIKTSLSSLTGNEPALEELATPFISLNNEQLRMINTNEDNGDVIIFTSKGLESLNTSNYVREDNIKIYNKQGVLKQSYELPSIIDGRNIRLTGFYSSYSNYLIFTN